MMMDVGMFAADPRGDEGMDWTIYLGPEKRLALTCMYHVLYVLSHERRPWNLGRLARYYGKWEEARDWIVSDDDEEGTFVWCLQILEIEGWEDRIRLRIMEQIDESGTIECDFSLLSNFDNANQWTAMKGE